MRVLFYQDLLTDKHDWTWRVGHIWKDTVVQRQLQESGVECRMLVNELGRGEALKYGLEERDLIVVPAAEVQAALIDPHDKINHLFHERFFYQLAEHDGPGLRFRQWWQSLTASAHWHPEIWQRRYALAVHDRLRAVLTKTITGFAPDLITTWCPIPFVATLAPRAKILHKEAGFFGMAPFPWSHYFDPRGFHAHSWLRHHFAEARTTSPAAQNALARLQAEFVPLIREHSPYRQRLQELRAQYRRLVVVALQANNYFLFDRSCPYRSQAEILLDIARHVPPDVGLLVTQHLSHPLLSGLERDRLLSRHPNLILDAAFETFHAPSQYLLAEADLLITIGSAVGWLAGFLGKPMVTLADCHLTPLSAVRSLGELPALLENPTAAPIDTAHLAWVLFHYSIPESVYQRPGFARSIFERFPGDAPFREPVLPYEDYADLIIHEANRTIPVARGG